MKSKMKDANTVARNFYTDLYRHTTFPLPRIRRMRFQEINQLIRKYAFHAKRLLDYGGGDGSLFTFIDNKDSYFVIDIAETQKFNNNIPKKQRLLFNKDWKIPVKDNYFDVVVLSEVFEHLLNPLNTLLEVQRVLKKDGVLIITVPNAFSTYFIAKSVFGKYIDPSFEHVALYDYSHLTNMTKNIGFAMQEHFTRYFLFGRVYDALFGWADPILSKILPNNNTQLFIVFTNRKK